MGVSPPWWHGRPPTRGVRMRGGRAQLNRCTRVDESVLRCQVNAAGTRQLFLRYPHDSFEAELPPMLLRERIRDGAEG